MYSNTDSARVEYDAEADLYEATYDAATPPSVAIPTAMEQITGTAMAKLDPTYEVLDLEALDDLFRPMAGGLADRSGRMSFNHRNHRITVFSDGLLTIRPLDGNSEGDDFDADRRDDTVDAD
ncbi:HalOD1 output domain-containing protein [Halorussus salinisoli]|uniref:HalOD1 output domain-containing protein n=1 Tax=Halorussus salinisoli TaxID=2558242 RepID=UPI0010C1D42F|nr:HalOD1 output domain-containing protein [Halorussus salinisoli]